MPRYEHEQLVEHLRRLNTPPESPDEFQEWLSADQHLQLLRENATSDELIVHASGRHTLVHAVAVAQDKLIPTRQEDLLRWSGDLFSGRAGYVVSGSDLSVDQGGDGWGTETLRGATRLVFGRTLHGFGQDDGLHFQLLQEYEHISEVHWRSEQHSYCRFDEYGDFRHVVSVTSRNEPGGPTLVSFRREELEHYLVASESVLVRLFDFMLLDFSDFDGWSDDPEKTIGESGDLFYRQKIDPRASYVRGVQVVRPVRTKAEIAPILMWGPEDDRHVEFEALDWRHNRLTMISTEPAATTNYFEADENQLPLELSPAFFRPDVLSKYKSDREKYTINEGHRTISCRGGWSLRYDVNDAGQLHAYICDLRGIPFREQQYWQTFNEKPKGSISQRAFENDFKGEPVDFSTPRDDLLAIVQSWSSTGVEWWTLRDEGLIDNVNTPLSSSSDEWAQAFQDLANLVVAGFEVGILRRDLAALNVAFDKDHGSLVLLEKLLREHGALAAGAKLEGLRAVQEIRSLVAAHIRGDGAAELGRAALETHGAYAAHFQHVCGMVAGELRTVEAALS